MALTQGVLEHVRELALPERDMVPPWIREGNDDLLQERQRLVDVGRFFQDLPFGLQRRLKGKA